VADLLALERLLDLREDAAVAAMEIGDARAVFLEVFAFGFFSS
jgi:hypothetical protein